MSDRFNILAKFLERYDDEVEGRALPEPADETKSKLRQLARGKLPEPEQEELFVLLNRNPNWIAWLAREVKTLRSDDSPKIETT
jgi:hypothetical protein